MAGTPNDHDPYAAFRFRDYRLFAIGGLASVIGTQIQGVAIGWEIYLRTNDPLALGLVGLVQAAPMFALALPAGHLADVYNRRRIVAFSMFAATLTSLGLAYLSYVQGSTPWMYGLLLLDATVIVLGRPARIAIAPALVPREVFPNAMMWRSSMFQVSLVVGPALGGFIVAWHVPAAYVICAASSLVFLVMLAMLDYRHKPEANHEQSTWQFLMEGVRFVMRTRLMLAAVSLDMFAVLLGGAVYLMPIFARDILKVGPMGLGWLNAAPAAGALLMAVWMAHRPPMEHAGRNLLLAVAGFGAATIVFGLSRNFYLSLAMLFVAGTMDNISVVVRHTLVQMITPDAMRGRVSAVNSIFIGASNELGGFESGLVARLFSPVISVVAGGVGTILVVLGMTAASPPLRRLGSLESAKPQDEVLD